jgi:hypothetical protein
MSPLWMLGGDTLQIWSTDAGNPLRKWHGDHLLLLSAATVQDGHRPAPELAGSPGPNQSEVMYTLADHVDCIRSI